MADLLHLNLTNGILPLVVLLALAIGIPAVLAGETTSHARLATAIGVGGLIVWATGAGIMAALYSSVNNGAFGGIWQFFQRSALMGLLWGPVLALVWLIRAQGVERRRGLLMGRGDP